MTHRIAVTRLHGRSLALSLVGLAAVLAITIGLWQLNAATHGLQVTRGWVGTVPVTLYRPDNAKPAPVVVIAHGFAGSQTLMQPYAVTLARNGYLTVTFDFPGHGRNSEPFVPGLQDREKRLRILLGALERVVDFALAQPDADGRLALLGHSMAGDVLVHYALGHPDRVAASILVSPYLSDEAHTDTLRNLLLIYGALEPEPLHRQGFAVIATHLGHAIDAGVTYRNPTAGDARRLVLAEGVEHIGVLYGQAGLASALEWLNQTFGWSGQGFLDQRGSWLGLLYLGLVALVWPLAQWLPRAATQPLGAGLGWRRLLPVAMAPALLTPLILWKMPNDVLPILLGGYLMLHFAVYGLLTLLGLWLTHRRSAPTRSATPRGRVFGWGLLGATLAASLYATLVMALPADRFVTTLIPGPQRLPLVLALLAGTLIYFTADEWLTRGTGAARGAYAATKVLFLLSLLLAIVLNLNELFFLIIIVPAILILFLVYGLISGWIYRRTRHPLVAAIANALAFACAMAVTFPVVAATQ